MPVGDRYPAMGRPSVSPVGPGGTRRAGAGRRVGGVRPSGDRRPSPYARRAAPMPVTFGQRSADKVTLAAGFVLGAGALMGLQLIRRAATAFGDTVRPGATARAAGGRWWSRH